MNLKNLGLSFIFLSLINAIAHSFGFNLPALEWFFHLADKPISSTFSLASFIGYLSCFLFFIFGWALFFQKITWTPNPLTLKKWQRFRSIKRAYISLLIFGFLLFLALLNQVLVGKKPLIVKYEGNFYFPAFTQRIFSGDFFSQNSSAEADYRLLRKQFLKQEKGNWMLMPLIPYQSTFDTDDRQILKLQEKEGIYFHHKNKNRPYSGIAYYYYKDFENKVFKKARFRQGKLDGFAELYMPNGQLFLREEWNKGRRVKVQKMSDFENQDIRISSPKVLLYPPLTPSFEKKHYFGTSSNGWDVAAQIFGGLQVLFKAIVIFLFITYSIGISLGCLMGYWGGKFDIIVQRFVEVLSNIPYLLVVIILTDRLGRDQVNLGVILCILCLFSWIGITYFIRAATYKEKARDYVVAVRLLGGSTPRIIFSHILPNVISTVITVVPFSVASIAISLTALDFLGFGLPEKYPSWGRLLSDGVANLGSPWIVSSVFVSMMTLLLLVTFIGEGIREAFDPKKFSTYQ